MTEPEPFEVRCRDGYVLHGHRWSRGPRVVIVNAATGVLARYYHRYARFLAEQGFAAVTYDYRGIGESRPPRLKGSGIRWRDWGELDFDAVVDHVRPAAETISVVGHSIGGFAVGLAPAAVHVDRILAVGAQYAYYRDYAGTHRAKLFLKWHMAMPAVTALLGYFPGRRLGWLEDLPAGVANEWSFRGARYEASFPRAERADVLARFAAVRAQVLAIRMTDDEFATPSAVERGLAYYTGTKSAHVALAPRDLGFERVGHFDLFHARHRDGFWQKSAEWLSTGANPWAT